MVFVWTFVHIYGFEPAKMKPNLNWSQLDEEFEETNELDKCFYEPVTA